jgi:hypothetical protein
MTARRAYQLSLALPIIFPLLAIAPVYLGKSFLPESVFIFFTIILASGIIGGLPYLIVVAGLLLWAPDHSTISFRKAILITPLLLILIHVVILLALIIWQLFKREPSDSEINLALGLMAIFAGCDLFFGYIYILLVFGGIRILQNGGYVEKLEDETTT